MDAILAVLYNSQLVFKSSNNVSEDRLKKRKSSLSACPDISCILADAFSYHHTQIRDRQIKHGAITSLLAKLVFHKKKHTVRIQEVSSKNIHKYNAGKPRERR